MSIDETFRRETYLVVFSVFVEQVLDPPHFFFRDPHGAVARGAGFFDELLHDAGRLFWFLAFRSAGFIRFLTS